MGKVFSGFVLVDESDKPVELMLSAAGLIMAWSDADAAKKWRVSSERLMKAEIHILEAVEDDPMELSRFATSLT